MRARIWLLLAIAASSVTCLYAFKVLGPWEHFVDVEHGKLKAQMGDLYPRWVGTRELLLHGRNPYGPDVSHEIQLAFYGHPIYQNYGRPEAEMVDEQRFAYPVYVVFLLAPSIYVDFPKAQKLVAVSLALLTALSAWLWIDALRWRLPPVLVLAIALFIVSSPQVVQGLRLGQLGLAVGFFLALGCWCISRNHLGIAGIALAVSTIKPQMVVLPVAWFMLWAISAWPKRWRLVAGFAGTLVVLSGLGEILLPGWIGFFVDGLIAYPKYVPMPSLLRTALGNSIGAVVSGAIVIGLLAWAFKNRHAAGDSDRFFRTLAGFFVGSALVLPLLPPFNQVTLILPAMMVCRHWAKVPQIGRYAFTIVVAGPWVACLGLLLIPHLNPWHRYPLLPSAIALFLPFVLATLLGSPTEIANDNWKV